MNILILGGTSEGRELARRLSADSDHSVVVSLAGRTTDPIGHEADVITGGFGGADGLTGFLQERRIDLLLDATHPFAETISNIAVLASGRAGVPLIRIERPRWTRMAGDQWVEVGSHQQAVDALGVAPRRVFLAIGRQHVPVYLGSPQHFYLVRSIEPVEGLDRFAHAEQILARGPFQQKEEMALLQAHGIDVMVTKNAGGEATEAKIAAARALGLPVIMIGQPQTDRPCSVASIEEAMQRVETIRMSVGC